MLSRSLFALALVASLILFALIGTSVATPTSATQTGGCCASCPDCCNADCCNDTCCTDGCCSNGCCPACGDCCQAA